MGDVDMGRLVCLSHIIHPELILRGQGIYHGDLSVTRHTILAVRAKIRQNYLVFSYIIHIPHYHIQSLETAMKSLAVVVLREIIGLLPNGVCTACDTVRVWSYDSSEETLARIVDIIIDVVVSQDYILVASVPVRSPESHDAGSEIGHLHCKVSCLQCI